MGVSKPTHTDEEKERYDREYDRIFGQVHKAPSGAEYRIKLDGDSLILCTKLKNPTQYKNEDDLTRQVEKDLIYLEKKIGYKIIPSSKKKKTK